MKTNSLIRFIFIFSGVVIICISFWSFSTTKTNSIEAKKYCELVYDSRIDPQTIFNVQQNYIVKIWANYSNYENSSIENNKLATLKGSIDALNYMGSNGWKLIDHYRLNFDNGFTQDIYLMEK